MKTPITTRALRGVAATIAASALLLAGCGSTNPMAATGNAGAETRAKIEAALRDAMATDHLRAVIVRITANGEDVYTAALGESGDGVPATPDMRFRNGAFAFTYIGMPSRGSPTPARCRSTTSSPGGFRKCHVRT
jgi:hypothetical protein